MASLHKVKVEDSETITQTISMPGKVRNALVASAKENERSLSAEIMFRVKQSLKSEGLAV